MAAHQALPSLGLSRQEHWSGLPCPSPVHESEKWKWSCSVVSNSQQPHELQPTRLLCPWDFFQARVLECVAIAFSDCLLSVQFSRSVVSDSLWPHESQHATPPCPSPIPGVYSNPCPSSRWCHPTISFSVVPFSSCHQSLPASGSFPMNQLFAWGGQSIGVSASASVLPMTTQDWSPLGMDWLDLLAVQGTLKSLLPHHSSKASIFWLSA